MVINKDSHFLKHFAFVFGSQMIVFLSGLVKALVIPILLGVADYAYWQIYVFYAVYVGIFTLGYGDGLYLKYGGYNHDKLPLERMRTANGVYLLTLIVGACALAAFAAQNVDTQRQFIFYAIAANGIVLGITASVSLSLQATNQLKGYAFINSADKVFFLLALTSVLIKDFRNFETLVLIDIGSKAFVLTMLLQRYRQLFFGRLSNLIVGIKEYWGNVGSGIQLLIANLSGMLVLGVGRIVVEYFGKLETYAHYAFAISLANVALMSITALSVVLYPALKREPQEHFGVFFDKTNKAYLGFALIMMCGYFPAALFVKLAALEYEPVLAFLNAIFAITVLQGKMQLLNNTYYKAMRLEREMLAANVSSLLIVTVLSATGYFLTESILAVAYAALLTMLFRVYYSEMYLRRKMSLQYPTLIAKEILTLCAFLLITIYLPMSLATVGWLVIVAAIALNNRTMIANLWQQLGGKTK